MTSSSKSLAGAWRSTLNTRKVMLFAGLLTVGVDCDGAGEKRQPDLPTAPPSPPAVTPTPPQPVVPSLWLGPQSRELMVGTSFVITGSANPDVLNHPESSDSTVVIAWRADDKGAVSAQAIDAQRVRVRGERAGDGWIRGSALGIKEYVYVTVLDAADTSAVSPVVVDDFRVFEHFRRKDGDPTYSPQFTLHDRTASGGAALIAVSVDIPGLDTTEPCAMLRAISAAPSMVFFYDSYFQDFEYNIRQAARASTGTVAVAHLVVRLPNRTAMRLTVSGPIVPESQLPGDDYYPAPGDYLSCQ